MTSAQPVEQERRDLQSRVQFRSGAHNTKHFGSALRIDRDMANLNVVTCVL